MPLIRKGSSPKTIAANRANCWNSHGGTRTAGRLEHGILAKVDPFTMQELGEDPAEYAQLREGMLESLAPQDALEEALAVEMVDSLWRKRRLRRGEAGQQAEQRRTLKLERQHKLASEGKNAGAAFQTKLAAEMGIVGLRDSNFKLEYTILLLRDVAAAAQLGEFSAPLLQALQMLYGPRPTVTAGTLISFYQNCVMAAVGGKPVDEAVADEVRRTLKAEIQCFETLKQLYYSMEISVPPSLLDSRLLLSNKDSKKLNRYEMTIAHQFYNALDRFMEYRRYRLTLGGGAEPALVDVEASSDGAGSQPATGGDSPGPGESDGPADGQMDDSKVASSTPSEDATDGHEGTPDSKAASSRCTSSEGATQGQEGATPDSKAPSSRGTPSEDATDGHEGITPDSNSESNRRTPSEDATDGHKG